MQITFAYILHLWIPFGWTNLSKLKSLRTNPCIKIWEIRRTFWDQGAKLSRLWSHSAFLTAHSTINFSCRGNEIDHEGARSFVGFCCVFDKLYRLCELPRIPKKVMAVWEDHCFTLQWPGLQRHQNAQYVGSRYAERSWTGDKTVWSLD